MRRFNGYNISSLLLGYGFLYLPIALLIIFSFNESSTMVWTGFSTHWYSELMENEGLLSAVQTSLQIASITATCSVIIATFAALAMVRIRRFPGRMLFSGLMTAPLVMPEVMMGLSLLMMFVTFERLCGWPSERGIMTVTLAHITLSITYVYLIVFARLKDFDCSLEEAALDLGARPEKVFFVITLPLIAPSLVSGWLLSFALSLDDVVIASFLSGPGATTLPMLIFSNIRIGLSPEMNALAAIIVGIVALVVLILGIVMRPKKHKMKN
jgi:putrescine transport system permease protein